jgi:RimJ/RimL family protein N-acetyltransferase
MRNFGSSLERISNKLLSSEAAVEVVKPGHRVFVGTACATPFTLGAAASRGGKPIVCLGPTTDEGKESCIRPSLLAGEGVTLARPDVHYVVTEFGIAYLFGKSVRERALALIEIAHPDFRESLLEEAKRQSLVSTAHRLGGGRGYLVEEERVIPHKSGCNVMLRPARGSDVQSMQVMFHRMSSEDVYMRFFRSISALSYEEAQRLCNVDFDKDVAFVAVVGPRKSEEIVGTGAYFLNPSTNLAEVAYIIVPACQRSGLGTALQQRLKEFAVDRGVRGFVAELLQANRAMLNLAKRLGNIEIKTVDDEYHITSIFA